jgi:murein DD-endopeptidase MepM/ murein hydrolase activator NlpD
MTPEQVAAAGKGRFIWPVQGSVVAGFGPMAGGKTNGGVNISAPAGSAVKVAAAGDVVYVGNQIPGYGTMVVVLHADGWATAHAYLAKADVKMRDHLEQGDSIGEVGYPPGGADDPTGAQGPAISQVHFEIRHAAKPLDPALVLPSQ